MESNKISEDSLFQDYFRIGWDQTEMLNRAQSIKIDEDYNYNDGELRVKHQVARPICFGHRASSQEQRKNKSLALLIV
jgi:hypothetical protein